MPREYGIVYFDGICNLCNGCVDFLIRRDRKRRLRYASLQSPRGRRMIRQYGFENGDQESILYVEDNELFVESDAVIRVIARLGGVYRLSLVLAVIPRPLRDFVYRRVARHRYRIFGKRDTCRVPSQEERALFVEDG